MRETRMKRSKHISYIRRVKVIEFVHRQTSSHSLPSFFIAPSVVRAVRRENISFGFETDI